MKSKLLTLVSMVTLMLNTNLLHANLNTHGIDFKNAPKSEYHIHLGGAFPLSFLLKYATTEQREILEQTLMEYKERQDYSGVFRIFSMISSIVNTPERLTEGTKALCDWLQEDHVEYVEIRTGLKDLGTGLRGYLESVLSAINSKNNKKFLAKLILSVKRHSPLSYVKETIDLALEYRHLGVIGIDISDRSDIGDISHIIGELKRAKDSGLKIFAHLGEVPNEEDQDLIVKVLGPDRIGHGVHLNKNTEEWMLKNKVPLEVCLTSSEISGMLTHYKNHPGLKYYKQWKHPTYLCSDDPLLFQSSLSEEFQKLEELNLLSKEELLNLLK